MNALKTALDSGIQQSIPIKKLSSKRSLPWITQEIRRLMRKRDKLYHKQKSESNKDRCHFKQVKHLVQRKIKIALENYLADILGVGSGDGEDNSGFSSNKLFNLLKNSSLKDSENTLHSGNVKKANLFNSHFQSDFFSRLSPLRLWQLCIQNIHNIFQENVPEDTNPICPAIQEIKIDLNGVL